MPDADTGDLFIAETIPVAKSPPITSTPATNATRLLSLRAMIPFLGVRLQPRPAGALPAAAQGRRISDHRDVRSGGWPTRTVRVGRPTSTAGETTRVLLCFGRFRQFERVAVDPLGHGAAADALRANAHRLSRAVGRGYVDPLQVGAKLPTADAGYLRAHPAEVFGLAAMGHRVAQDGLLSTDFTCLGHSRHSPLGQYCQHWAKPSIYRPAGRCKGTSYESGAERKRPCTAATFASHGSILFRSSTRDTIHESGAPQGRRISPSFPYFSKVS